MMLSESGEEGMEYDIQFGRRIEEMVIHVAVDGC